jgi:ubiquinone/menaquinone biosynthesis C-methylase UbiE
VVHSTGPWHAIYEIDSLSASKARGECAKSGTALGNLNLLQKAIESTMDTPRSYPSPPVTPASSPERLQAQYYEGNSSLYDRLHNAREDHEHNLALRYIDMLSTTHGLHTFLDVGAGTGRGVRFLRDRGKQVRGIEPVPAMIEQAELNGIPKGMVIQGSGYDLPFEDQSFDAVFECGVLHHVANPNRVVDEMIRVARKAIFLSDSNRFGQGSYYARWIKLGLYKCRLWHTARFIQTKGKMYTVSDGDGLAYSYSVFDSYSQLAAKTQSTWLLPTASDTPPRLSWAHPLLTCSHVLLCAFKD